MKPKTEIRKPRVRKRIDNGKPKRAYAYPSAFPSRGVEVVSYYLSAAPVSLMSKVRARAAREDISMRVLILGLLQDWLAQETTPTHK